MNDFLRTLLVYWVGDEITNLKYCIAFIYGHCAHSHLPGVSLPIAPNCVEDKR